MKENKAGGDVRWKKGRTSLFTQNISVLSEIFIPKTYSLFLRECTKWKEKKKDQCLILKIQL